MTPESVMMMGTEAMKVALALAAPLLLVALVTGLIISILQAATQINEMTGPQAACEFFQPALVFHFCLVLHPDDSQPAFL